MKSSPLATVIIPTYNYGRYVCEAVESVLAQSFPQEEIEIIVVDDGSTDDTRERVCRYGARVRYVFQGNRGKASATQAGVDLARGKYIFNLDADDLFLPEKISEAVEVFESDETVAHVGHPALCWDEARGAKSVERPPARIVGRKTDGRALLIDFYKQRLLFGGGSTFSARAEVLKRCPIPPEVDMYVDEYLVLAALNRGPSYFIERPLSVWRIHGENFSGSAGPEKALRSVKSVNAVLSAVLCGDFDAELKTLYTLKAKVARVALGERAGRKSYADVLDLLRCQLGAFRVFGRESFGIMRRYAVLNRAVPTPLLQLARRAAGK